MGTPYLQANYDAFQVKALMELEIREGDKWVRFESAIINGAGSYGIYTRDLRKEIRQAKGPRKVTLMVWKRWKTVLIPQTLKWIPLKYIW